MHTHKSLCMQSNIHWDSSRCFCSLCYSWENYISQIIKRDGGKRDYGTVMSGLSCGTKHSLGWQRHTERESINHLQVPLQSLSGGRVASPARVTWSDDMDTHCRTLADCVKTKSGIHLVMLMYLTFIKAYNLSWKCTDTTIHKKEFIHSSAPLRTIQMPLFHFSSHLLSPKQ